MKTVYFYTLILFISLSCESNIVSPDDSKKSDQPTEILSIQFNGKPFNPKTDTLQVIPCDSMFLELKIADKDKIQSFSASQIYSLSDSINYSVALSDTVTLRVGFVADWNLSTDGTRTYFVSYTDNSGHYYRTNFIVKVNPYQVFRLYRSECFGDCPSYEIIIFSDRTVKFTGYSNVKQIGVRYSELTTEAYLNLVNEFNTKEFLKINYTPLPTCTDVPYSSVRYNFKCEKNAAWRYAYCSSDVPQALIDCESLIDSVTNSDPWIK